MDKGGGGSWKLDNFHGRYICIVPNTMQYLHFLKNNIYHSNKRGQPPFYHLNTIPVLGRVLEHSVDKTHVLVVTVELIWLLFLNKLSFNFVPTPNKSLMFTIFRRSYVNQTAVVLTNHCQSYTTFYLDMHCSKWPRFFFSFFCSRLAPMMCICVTYFCWAHLLLECCWLQGG